MTSRRQKSRNQLTYQCPLDPEAAALECEDPERVAGVLGPAIDDMEKPGAREASGGNPDANTPDCVVRKSAAPDLVAGNP